MIRDADNRHLFSTRLSVYVVLLLLCLVLTCLFLLDVSSVSAAVTRQEPDPTPPPDLAEIADTQDEQATETSPDLGSEADPAPEVSPELGTETDPESESFPDELVDPLSAPLQIPDFPPNRRTLYKVRETVRHHWMLTRLDEQKVNCHIYLSTVGEPSDEEVLGYCGYQVYQQWLQGVCYQTVDRETPCEGLTLHYIQPIDEKLEVSIKLPGAVAYVGLVNCGPWGICDQPPQLLFGGEDPLAPYRVSLVHVEFEDGQEYVCAASQCAVLLPYTNANGMGAIYYVTSSYGDDSLETTFLYRNIDLADGTYQFELIGTDLDQYVPTGAVRWGFFPDLDIDRVSWLSPVNTAEDLFSSHDYSFLAGTMILRGDVSASNCEDGGLLASGAASACGLEKARSQVVEAQNLLNEQIFGAATRNQVPPRLLKGLIGQESQFWNGWVIEGEYGYGMLTDEGADLLLTWHVDTFLELCIPVYGINECAWGYTKLGEYPRAYLRGLAMQDIGTEDEFDLIAQTLSAAAGQTGQIIRNVTDQEPGSVLDYREMWLISLGLYHGGSGCVGNAIEEAWEAEGKLSWGTISDYLVGDCQLVASYPYLVARYAEPPSEP